MSEKIEWEHQLNAYAFLVRSTMSEGDVQGLKINAIIRDFSRRQAEKVPGYPAAPVHQVDVPLWTFEQQRDYIHARLAAHAQALMDEPPVCTPEERWERLFDWIADFNQSDLGEASKIVSDIIEEAGKVSVS